MCGRRGERRSDVKMQRKKLFLAVLAAALLVGAVSAAVITFFGQVKMTATVSQAVLLDGKDYTEMPINESATVAGGECVCTYHWLQSQTSVPVDLKFVTSITDDGGITVEYYKAGELQLGSEDFKYRDPEVPYVDSVKLYFSDGKAVWEVKLNGTLISGHWETGAQVCIATATKPLFCVGWTPGVGANYKEYTTGGWGDSQPLPDGFEVIGVKNSEEFVIKIPFERIADCKWAINIEASWPNHSGSCWAQYPKEWGRWGNAASGTAEFPKGDQITSPFTLQPFERLDFIICYKFEVNIKPGEYIITTTVKPA